MDRSSTSRSSAMAGMLAIVVAGLLGALAYAPAAWGAGLRLTGGETQLTLDRGLIGALRQEGVGVKALGPAKLKGRELTLPVASGNFDPEANRATFSQSGGLKLVSGAKAVALRKLRFDPGARALNATVGGKKLLLAHLGGTKTKRVGFDARITSRRLPLTRAAAAALNGVLGLPEVLQAGRSLGSARGLGEPATIPISYGRIVLGGPDTTLTKLRSLNVQMGLWGGTEGWGEGAEKSFIFEVAPTAVPPDASAGILEGSGNDGVTMQIHESPPREMLLRGPRIDLEARELSATLSPLSKENPVTATIATLDYSDAEFNVRPKVGVFELMGIRAVSNQLIADQLNERFDMPGVFQAGETLAKVVVNLNAK